MPLQQSFNHIDHKSQCAEQRFREAFKRLKNGCPQLLPVGALVSQNNVAQEAGCTPSALRRERFPTLVAEIQRHLAQGGHTKRSDDRYELALARIAKISAERDATELRYQSAASEVLDLLAELAELKRLLACHRRNSATQLGSVDPSLPRRTHLREVGPTCVEGVKPQILPAEGAPSKDRLPKASQGKALKLSKRGVNNQ